MALDGVWITITMVLALFRVSKSKDQNGREMDVKEEYSDAGIRYGHPIMRLLWATDRISIAVTRIHTNAQSSHDMTVSRS